MRLPLISALALLLLTTAPAAAQVTAKRDGLVGGPGGAPFEHLCGPGRYLTGFHVHTGAAVDAIGPVCSTWNPERRLMEAHEAPPRFYGGEGGDRILTYRCATDAAVESLTAQSAENEWRSLSYVLAFCREARPPYARVDQGPIRGESNHANFPATAACGRDQVAIGLRGRAGNLVDAIGLVCGPRPPLPASRSDAVVTQPSPSLGDMVRRTPSRIGHTGSVVAAPVDPPPTAPSAAGRCKAGFVWRQASIADRVCVTPESRMLVREEGASAASRVDPAGAYGPATCLSGFVWREAFDGDVVCVTPERRAAVRAENAAAASRTN